MGDFLLTKTLARQAAFELNVGTRLAPLWRRIQGLTDKNASATVTRADTTTDDEDGVESHLPASRGRSFSIGGRKGYVNLATGVRDPGQLAAEEWAGETSIGPAGLRQIRRVLPDGVGSFEMFDASASISDGGGLNDADGWSIDVQKSGPTTKGRLGVAPAIPVPGVLTPGAGSVSIAYTAADSPAAVEAFAYLASTDEEIGYVSDAGGTSPVDVTGLDTVAHYFRLRSVSATGAISALSAPTATATPSS